MMEAPLTLWLTWDCLLKHHHHHIRTHWPKQKLIITSIKVCSLLYERFEDDYNEKTHKEKDRVSTDLEGGKNVTEQTCIPPFPELRFVPCIHLNLCNEVANRVKSTYYFLSLFAQIIFHLVSHITLREWMLLLTEYCCYRSWFVFLRNIIV